MKKETFDYIYLNKRKILYSSLIGGVVFLSFIPLLNFSYKYSKESKIYSNHLERIVKRELKLKEDPSENQMRNFIAEKLKIKPEEYLLSLRYIKKVVSMYEN
jgi:hypothetical protein